MNELEKIEAVQRMQEYIHQNIHDDISLDSICNASGYSKRHAFRIFKEVLSKTPFEYIRALRITQAARSIKKSSGISIIDVALDAGFGTNEGFTKAFFSHFKINPNEYRNHVPRKFMYFQPSPVLHSHLLGISKEYKDMQEIQRTVTATVFTKPKCQLILKRGILSQDYFAYCEEMGCDIFEVLETIPNTSDEVVFIELPPCMMKQGTSKAAVAVEVPIGFCETIPDGLELMELPESQYICFNGAPYKDPSWFGEAHQELYRAIENYQPEQYGYEFAKESAPVFNYFASAEKGVKLSIPIKKVIPSQE